MNRFSVISSNKNVENKIEDSQLDCKDCNNYWLVKKYTKQLDMLWCEDASEFNSTGPGHFDTCKNYLD